MIIGPQIGLYKNWQIIAIEVLRQRADERHGNHPPGNQEPSVFEDKVGKPSGELGVSKNVECNIFPSVVWFVGGDDLTGSFAVVTSTPVLWHRCLATVKKWSAGDMF